MTWLIFAVAVALVVVLLLATEKPLANRRIKNTTTTIQPNAYTERKLMTPVETKLYHRLRAALPECLIFTQVAMNRTIETPKGQWAIFNTISSKSFDFVVCLADGTIVAAIELQDATHNAPLRKRADLAKAVACQQAGIKLIYWHVVTMPSEEEIRRVFTE